MIGRAKSRNILVVGSDPTQRGFAAAVLASAGYGVHEAGDSWQAFAQCESLDRPLHLLVAEVCPGRGPGGVELFRHLRVLRPAMKALYLSNVPSDPALRMELQSALDSYLSIPFSREGLLAKAARLLEREGAGNRKLWAKGREDWAPAGEPAPG
jgi:CheY-like chemotaxis protein